MEHKIEYSALGKRIRRLRYAKHLTQEQLAENCNLSAAHIGHIERGTRILSLEVLFKIATCFHVSLDYLLFDSFPINENLFIPILTILQGKDSKKVKSFMIMVRALADKIDDL